MSLPRYSEYKDSGIGWLGRVPAHWPVVQSRRYFANRNEKAHPEDKQLTASQKHGVVYQAEFMELEGQKVMQVIVGADILKHAEPNDFVISMRSFQGGIEWCGLRGSISSAYVMLVPKQTIWSPFYRFLFKSAPYIQALQATTNLVRDGQALRFSNFAQVPLPLPPVTEQQYIATFLDRETAKIDALIAEQEKLLALLAEKRQATISRAVTKGLYPEAPMKDSGVAWLGEVPEHWNATRLGHLVRQIVDGAHFTPTYVNEGVPFLRVTDITAATLDLNEVKRIPEAEHLELSRRCRPQKGDVLLSKNGTIGVPRVITWDWEFSIFVSLCLIKLGPKLIAKFVEYVFQSSTIRIQIEDGAKQSTVTNLHLEKIAGFKFPVPPIDEQLEIVRYLNDETAHLDALTMESASAIALLKERRSALIAAAVTGQIDVSGLVNVPEAA